jgi:hypothetical protein
MKKSRVVFPFLLLVSVLTICGMKANAQSSHPTMDSLDKNSRELLAVAMRFGDQYWDEEKGLVRAPERPQLNPANTDPSATPSRARNSTTASMGRSYYMVRESNWYALGLLLRDGPGDRERAAKIIEAVLNAQFRDPGKPWDGTFRQSPDAPEPNENATAFRGFDPNWRVFIGTTFALMLNEYPDRIPKELAQQMNDAIVYAIAGEIHEARLVPSYTNIALMYGYLWSYAAEKGGKTEWKQPAETWQEEVYKLYKEHDAFHEYNSPTYCGTDVFGLALWRKYGLTEKTRAMGREMEAGLWRATADFYNPNLRNISGPYDRSYGMDMQTYVAIMGLWLRLKMDASQAPLTGFKPPVEHNDDMFFIPEVVVLGAQIPDDAMKSFLSFKGEHEVRRPIEGIRTATAWIGNTLMYGGEITGHLRRVDASSEFHQFHPVTAQWLAPNGTVGWLKITRCPFIDADATKQGINITTEPGEVAFRILSPDVKPADVTANQWDLAGLTVKIDTDGTGFRAAAGEGYIDVTYSSVTRMKMQFVQTGK